VRILDSIAAGIFTVDRAFRIRYFNRTAERITGISRQQAMGKHCCDIMRCSESGKGCALEMSIHTGRETVNRHCAIHLRSGKTIPISITAAVLRDTSGKIVGGVESFRDLSAIVALQKELRRSYTFDDIISKNHIMQRLFDVLPDIAESDSTVLIQGASGTGKELFARAIHNRSPRRTMPLVAVNCGALPESLLESELFGYVRGAFTDANQNKKGRFALAQNGTIFLDEVESLSPATQVRLLRFLQEREFTPVGATEPVKADVRIVAATKVDLEGLVEQKWFREDLFYRLNVVKLELPPLAERREDIPLLVDAMIEKLNRKMMRSVRGASPDVLGVLLHHDYPGNVRQLENIIEYAFVMCREDQLELHHLPPDISGALHAACLAPSGHEPLQLAQREAIVTMLEKHGWNKSLAAKELGISRTTLWRKCVRFGLNVPGVSKA
jgi:PAS domain S-box-containing protein